MTTMEQAVSQLPQELLTIRAQIASRVQIASAVQARLVTTGPSSERCSESHRCERSGASEGILRQGRGFPTVVEKD